VKYAFIEANRKSFAVTMMCGALGVSRTGFYAGRGRAPSERDRQNECLRLEIRAIHGRASDATAARGYTTRCRRSRSDAARTGLHG
jgi:putative transposase